jgi:hypothetical protein
MISGDVGDVMGDRFLLFPPVFHLFSKSQAQWNGCLFWPDFLKSFPLFFPLPR